MARNGTGKARVFTLMATSMRAAGGRLFVGACIRGAAVSTRASFYEKQSKDGLMTWANGQTYKGGWRLLR